MGITRRNLFALTGGAVAGGILSPIPWKLLDDSAIWTQNWKWIPRPPAGPVAAKFTTCTLCGAGCAMEARCAGKAVIGIAPVASHPVSGGALCPAVFGAHQLPYHPRRLRHALVNGKTVSLADAMQAIADAVTKRVAGQGVALLDERPGRALSVAYQQLMHAVGGRVMTVSQPEDATLGAVERAAKVVPGTLGFDFEHAGVILSLGATLLDGWSVPGRLPRLWSRREKGAGPVFVHASSRLSRSALLSDQRFVLRPESEAALAAGLAGVLVRSGLAGDSRNRFAREAAAVSAEQVATLTGIPGPEIERLARLLAEHRPAIVIGGGEAASSGLTSAAESNIAGLNALLGSGGVAGGIIARRTAPGASTVPPDALDSVPDHSLAVLIHDASTAGIVIPEALLRRKLAAGGTLVRLAAFQPETRFDREVAIPATTFLEAMDDAAGPRDATTGSWSLAPALLEPPAGAVSTAAFVSGLATALGVEVTGPEELMKQKSAAIFAARRGKLFNPADRSTTEVRTVANADALWKTFSEGATWIDEPSSLPAPAINLDKVAVQIPDARATQLTLVPVAWRGSAYCPLATKVERESRLRPVAGDARVNPQTAAHLGLTSGDAVAVGSETNEIRARVRTEAIVAPGLVEMAAGGPHRDAVLQLAGASVRIRKVDA